MRQASTRIEIETAGEGLYDVTAQAKRFVAAQGIKTGLLTVFIAHTSASLVIQENADRDVLRDLQTFFDRIAPKTARYRHDTEGPDDMPAHIRSALTQSSLGIPVIEGALALGTWQGIYAFEHRAKARKRSLILHLSGI